MRQHITLEQWDELTHKQKNMLDDFGCKHDWRMNIGQMIEFLGEDLVKPTGNCSDPGCCWGDESRIDFSFSGELIDALWEAVKNKLRRAT